MKRFFACVAMLLLFAPTLSFAVSLPEFSRQVNALRARGPDLEAAKFSLDGTTETMMVDLSTITEVSSAAGVTRVELSWVRDIAADMRAEPLDSRRHLYWKCFIDTLDGLIESLNTGAFGRPTRSSADILAALRDTRRDVQSVRVRLAPGAGGESGLPDAALDQYAELPDQVEISAIRAEGGNFTGYGKNDLTVTQGGSYGGSFSGAPAAGSSSSSGSPGTSGSSASTGGSSSSFSSTSGGQTTGNPGSRPFPTTAPTQSPSGFTPPPPPPPPPPAPQLTGSAGILYWILGSLVCIVLAIVGFLIYRAWARSRALAAHKPLVLGSAAIDDEVRRRRNVDLYQQAIDEARKGNYEMGVRLMALAILLLLDQRGRMNFDKARTNGEYRLRILDEHPALGQVMDTPLRIFDRLYYGFKPASEADFQEFRGVFDKLEKSLT